MGIFRVVKSSGIQVMMEWTIQTVEAGIDDHRIQHDHLSSSRFWMGNQPLEGYVDVRLFFTRNGVATDFPVLNGCQIPLFSNKTKLVNVKNMIISTHICSMSSFSSKESGRSRLFPKTRTGIPWSWGLSRRLCNSFRDASIFSWSAASTM